MKSFDPNAKIELSENYTMQDLLAAGLMSYCAGFGTTPVTVQDPGAKQDNAAVAQELIEFFNFHHENKNESLGRQDYRLVAEALMFESQDLGMLKHLSFDEQLKVAIKIAGKMLMKSEQPALEKTEQVS